MRGGLIGVFPPLPARVWASRPSVPPPFPLGDPGYALFAQARSGLWAGLERLRPEPGDEFLVPAYHHGSEIETVSRAGFGLRFYGGGDRAEPDEAELESLLGPRSRGLYLIHYLGVPQAADRWRAWCDRRGLALVEDGAQAWMSRRDGRPVGVHGDLSIFCLYKMTGLPDGGAVRVRRGPPAAPTRGGGVGVKATLSLHRDHLLLRTTHKATSGDQPQPLREVPEIHFAPSPQGTSASWATRRLAARFDPEAIPARRRANYTALQGELAEQRSNAFGDLPDGASPLVFPVETMDKDGLLAHLARHGIAEGELWRVAHPALEPGRFPQADRLRDRLVGLPVHHELRPNQLERIARAARSWFDGGAR